jgi:hypothetical protein
MPKHTSLLLLALAVLVTASLACSVSLDLGQPTEVPGDPVATSVAATLTARPGGDSPDPTETPPQPPPATPTFTIHPTVTASPEPDVTFQCLSLSYPDPLAASVTGEVVPGETDPHNPWSFPEHYLLGLAGYPLADTFHEPAIRVYPAAEFRTVNDMVADRLANLDTVLANQPPDPEVGVAHFFNAGQFVKAQEAYLDFQSGSGVRFISQYGQAASPVGWPHLFYTFQGLTADGEYYVSAILPVNHPVLPHPDDVTMDQAFYDNYMTYTAQKEVELDGQPPASFVPSLLLLDDLVSSLQVDCP